MGYSWGIHGVFMGYTYVSGMCRVCIGYVSGMYRNIQGASRFFDGLVERNRRSCSPNGSRNNRSTDVDKKSKLSKPKFD